MDSSHLFFSFFFLFSNNSSIWKNRCPLDLDLWWFYSTQTRFVVVLVFISVFHFIGVVIIEICIIYDLELESLLILRIGFCINFSNKSIRSVNSNNKKSKQVSEEFNIMELFSKIIEGNHFCSKIFDDFIFIFKFMNQFLDSRYKRFQVTQSVIITFV